MNLAKTKETLSDESSVVVEPERLPEVLDILIVAEDRPERRPHSEPKNWDFPCW